jgi:hypothetical protein
MTRHDDTASPLTGPGRDESDWQAAIDFGFDASQIDYLLTLTVEQRLILHERAMLGQMELRALGRDYLGFDPRHSAPPDRS